MHVFMGIVYGKASRTSLWWIPCSTSTPLHSNEQVRLNRAVAPPRSWCSVSTLTMGSVTVCTNFKLPKKF